MPVAGWVFVGVGQTIGFRRLSCRAFRPAEGFPQKAVILGDYRRAGAFSSSALLRADHQKKQKRWSAPVCPGLPHGAAKTQPNQRRTTAIPLFAAKPRCATRDRRGAQRNTDLVAQA